MGRYVSQSVGAQPRRKIITLTASNPAVPIPTWAQNGKSIVYVSGCGGGASGAISDVAGQRGPGGSAPGQCLGVPLPIAAGLTTVAAVIGAAGPGVAAAVATPGIAGGESSLTVGALSVVLKGAPATPTGSYAPGGIALVNPAASVTGTAADGTAPASYGLVGQDHAYDAHLFKGCRGGAGTGADPDRYGAGASSLFGRGGPGLASAPANGTPGGNASGNGAGGAGANCTGATATTSGSGTPGILILEIVEGF